MKTSVLAAFPTYTARFEGLVNWFYKDVKGLVTIGAGLLADPNIPSGLTFGAASSADVKAAWQKVKNDTTLDPKNGGGRYASLTPVRADASSMSVAFESKLAQMECVLKTYLPNWENVPANAQLAALSHAWAFGPAFPVTWVNWRRCFNAGDYAGAAVQDLPSAQEWAAQNASFHARIQLEQQLLKTALQGDPDQVNYANAA